jgi:hypothetical protein
MKIDYSNMSRMAKIETDDDGMRLGYDGMLFVYI